MGTMQNYSLDENFLTLQDWSVNVYSYLTALKNPFMITHPFQTSSYRNLCDSTTNVLKQFDCDKLESVPLLFSNREDIRTSVSALEGNVQPSVKADLERLLQLVDDACVIYQPGAACKTAREDYKLHPSLGGQVSYNQVKN